jgi:hypothetical protein
MFDDFESDISILWCPMTLSSVGSKFKSLFKIQKSFKSWQWISKSHGENPALDYTFPVHVLYITLILHLINIRASSPGQGTFWFTLTGWRWTKLQLGRTPKFTQVGQTINLSFTYYRRDSMSSGFLSSKLYVPSDDFTNRSGNVRDCPASDCFKFS